MVQSREEFILDIMNQGLKMKEWQLCLQQLQAENKIPTEYKNSPVLLNKLAFIYMHAARSEEQHAKYIKLAHQTYAAALQKTENEKENYNSIKGMAYLYYSEYIGYNSLLFSNKASWPISIEECERNADILYEKIRLHRPDVLDLYRYAHLLYMASNNIHSIQSFGEIMEKRKKAYIIYLQAVEQYEHLQEKEKKRLQRIYIKSCYGVCRCGLGLIAKRSSLLNELILLFDFQPKEKEISSFEMKKFSEISHCLKCILREECLPTDAGDIIDIQTLANREQIIARSWDVYYMIGKFYDYSLQYTRCSDPHILYEKAEKYYKLACEIDCIRRQNKKMASGFKHMYMGLFKLYLRNRQEEAFYKSWNTYYYIIDFDDSYRFLFQARWLILKKEYREAKKLLEQCSEMIKGKNNNVNRKIDQLLDIVHILIEKNSCNIEEKYKPYQRKYLNELLQL
ncbi:MAG: hypothetical protein LKI76_03730 [Megasphaera sp.]|jgi:hypothetical protein|uniref:hypothetical protein n=1 Tax=Megasphaera sueciensis TaxID=349094 RepID=UPI003CFD4910|nr:hypothetical protein [Megasphaera sp.]MCI1823033.1 hypothetical protein [Megasphaera sp.]